MPGLPEGRHNVRVRSTALGRTGTGKDQIAVQFENEHGHATWYGFFTERALPYTIERLETCGWDGAADGWNPARLHESTALVGNEVEIVIEMDDDQDGKPRPKVAWINPIGGGVMRDVMDRVQADEFGSRIAQDIARLKGEPAPPDKSSQDEEIDLDGIPF